MTTRSVPAGNSVSACQTIAGSFPETSLSARAMSRSRLMPGKTTTADFISIPRRQGSAGSTADLDPIILDDGIGEQLLGGVFQRRLGTGAVAALDFDVENLALADARDPVHAQRLQGAFDGLALGIQNPRFQ